MKLIPENPIFPWVCLILMCGLMGTAWGLEENKAKAKIETALSLKPSVNLRVMCRQKQLGTLNDIEVRDIIYFNMDPELLAMFKYDQFVQLQGRNYHIDHQPIWHIEQNRLTLIVQAVRRADEPK